MTSSAPRVCTRHLEKERCKSARVQMYEVAGKCILPSQDESSFLKYFMSLGFLNLTLALDLPRVQYCNTMTRNIIAIKTELEWERHEAEVPTSSPHKGSVLFMNRELEQWRQVPSLARDAHCKLIRPYRYLKEKNH
ncbi:hypothetical protein RRG08_033148 [Elysia crispata]|uniref:Uncharacterized protein n=1 Tax=Elysia crispata TaxID=231223 RepID=A0AAE0YX56_9GAST|nr:hypothetical protein RRG08_033148 [Elysia crispata]